MNYQDARVGFIGGGRVVRILAGGWQAAGRLPNAMLVAEPDDAAFGQLVETCPDVRRSQLDEASGADVVFLALHPPAFAAVMPCVRPLLGPNALVVSLAPKVTLSALASGLGTARVARMIPNAPSIIGHGYNPVAYGPGFDDAARQLASALFAPWGAAPEVNEGDLEAYAILTGMGPTYFWYQWQALREVTGQMGLSAERADDALRQTIAGAVETLLRSGLSPAGVMDLIPVRPLAGIESSVGAAYREALPALYAKIHPPA